MKYGLAGAGAMGRNHARVIGKLEDTELVAVYDADKKRAKSVAKEFGAVAVDTLEELAQCCEAVSVAVPTIYHLKVGGELMRNGAHILVEKPIAGTLEEARELVKIAEEEDRVLAVGHIERFNPVMKTLEKLSGNALDNVQMASTGYGEIVPSACNVNAQGREINRRVEVWISTPGQS